jgi:hypothetical protein
MKESLTLSNHGKNMVKVTVRITLPLGFLETREHFIRQNEQN